MAGQPGSGGPEARRLTARRALGAAAITIGLVALMGMTLLLLRPISQAGCQPFWPTPNRTKALDLGFLRAHSRHTQGSLELKSSAVTRHFQSHDRRNFAAEVSVEEYSVAFGLPETDMQNPFYQMDPARRVIVVFSYGTFQWHVGADFAAQAAPDFYPYSVGMVGLDARDGSVLVGETPVCR